MEKITECKRCGKTISKYLLSIQDKPDSNEWVRLGFCSNACFAGDNSKQISKKVISEPNVSNISEDHIIDKIEGEENMIQCRRCGKSINKDNLSKQVLLDAEKWLGLGYCSNICLENRENSITYKESDTRKIVKDAKIAFTIVIIAYFLLIFGRLSYWFVILIPFAIAKAIIAYRKIDKNPTFFKGSGMATFALVLGSLYIVIIIAILSSVFGMNT